MIDMLSCLCVLLYLISCVCSLPHITDIYLVLYLYFISRVFPHILALLFPGENVKNMDQI